MAIRLGIGNIDLRNIRPFSWSAWWASRSLFWSDSLNFTLNKWNDKSNHPLNTPSLVKSNAISFNGSGWLDSGYIVTVNTEIEVFMKINVVGTNNFSGLFPAPYFTWGAYTLSRLRVLFGDKAINVPTVTLNTSPHVYKLNKTAFYIDDVPVLDIAGSGYTFNAVTIPLYFGGASGLTGQDAEYYYIKIRENGVLVREYYLSQGNLNTGIKDQLGNADLAFGGTGNAVALQNNCHYNLQKGFDLWQRDADGSYCYIPLKADGTSVKGSGATVTGFTWVAKYTQAGNQFLPCETKLNFPLTAELIATDTIPYLFNAAKDTPSDIGYFDIAQINYDYFSFSRMNDFIVANQAGNIQYFL